MILSFCEVQEKIRVYLDIIMRWCLCQVINIMNELVKILIEGGHSGVLKNGDKLLTFTRPGVADLYDIYMSTPEVLKGAMLADKVIGKAAASVAIAGGVSRIYALLISQHAVNLLAKYNIHFEYEKLVPYIQNRTKDGLCPMEALCLDVEAPLEAVKQIGEFIQRMRQKAS